jgi:hypothetical protein
MSALRHPPANRATINVEANCYARSEGDFDAMARRRFQDRKPRKEGAFWVLYYWQDEFIDGERRRRKKRRKLAPGTTPEREVRKIAAEFLRPVNQGLVPLGSASGFTEYVDGTYIPVVPEQMAVSTKGRYLGILRNYLTPQFGELALRDITTLSVDRYMAGLGTTKLAHESLDKIRDVLSSILASAVRYGLLLENPAEGVRLPHRRSGRKAKPWITRAQFDALVEFIREPYASMVYVAVFTGLRAGELVGLRWRNVHQDALTIEERYTHASPFSQWFRMLFNEALRRSHIEPQRSTNLDAGNLPQPGFSVNRVYFESQILGGLPDIQEPPTNDSI